MRKVIAAGIVLILFAPIVVAEDVLWTEDWTGYLGDTCPDFTPWVCTARDTGEAQEVVLDSLNAVMRIKAISGGQAPSVLRSWSESTPTGDYQFQFDFKRTTSPGTDHIFYLAAVRGYGSVYDLALLSMNSQGVLQIHARDLTTFTTNYTVPSSWRTYIMDIDDRPDYQSTTVTVTVKDGTTTEYSKTVYPGVYGQTWHATGFKMGGADDGDVTVEGEGMWDALQAVNFPPA